MAESLGIRRSRVPVYANINRRTIDRRPEGFAASASAASAAGHMAFKLAPFDEVTQEVCAAGNGGRAMLPGLARIAAVREAVGPDARLMVDCHWRFDEATAMLLNEAAAKLGVYWIECPLPEVEGSIPALTRLRRQCEALGMRQAGLEQSIGWAVIRPYCEAGAYDVVMPDVKYIGGVHELRRVASACADVGVAVSPHNPSGPISHAFSLQVSATLAELRPARDAVRRESAVRCARRRAFRANRRWSMPYAAIRTRPWCRAFGRPPRTSRRATHA